MKSLLKSLFFITIILSHGEDHDHSHDKTGNIFGYVYDQGSDKPLELVSISVFDINQDLVTGAVSDEDGFFNVERIFTGNYNIEIVYIGFNTLNLTVDLSEDAGKRKNLGRIAMTRKSIMSDEISVVDEKPLYEFETDKVVFNASDDIITGSGTAEDVLKKVPLVTVDQEGEVSLRGSADVRILVDGRPIRSEVSDIAASTIDKVEVITSASAKYSPEGMAGIINIVRKKGNYDGFNGSLRLNARNSDYFGPDKMNGLTFFSNYRKNKLNFYTSLSSNNRAKNSNGYRNVRTDYYLQDSEEVNFSESVNFSYENFNDRYSKRLKLGLDYYLSDELTLNWEFGIDSNLKDESGISRFTAPIEYQFNTTEIDDDDNYDSEGIFELIKTFTDNPGKEIFFTFSHHNHDDYETETYDDGTASESSTLNNRNGTYEMGLNYKYPINENVGFEFGYDGDYVESDQSLNFEIDALSGVNDFRYNRGIHALYIEYENKLSDKFSFKPSLRYEHVSKEVSSTIDLDNNEDSYDGDNVFAQFIQYSNDNPQGEINLNNGALYPNLNFTYNIIKSAKEDKNDNVPEQYKKYGNGDKIYSIQFGVSKRVNRPGGFGHGQGVMKIRPFPRDIYSGSFLFIGNPYLKPEYSTQYDISFKGPAPMGFFQTSLFYNEIKDKIEWYDDDSYQNLDITTFRNSANGYESGLSWFFVLAGQVFGGTYRKTTLNDKSDDYELNEGSTFMNSYFRMNLPEEYLSPFIKWWKFDFEYGFYWMKIETPTGDLFGKNGTLWGNVGLSKSFLDDNMRVSLSIDNIHDAPGFEMVRTKPLDFLESSQGVVYDSAFETTDTYNERGGRTISLSFRYNFGNNNDERNKKRIKSLDGGQRGGGEMDMGF